MQFEKTKTFQNLARSFAGECQAGMRYQFVAELAKQAGLQALESEIKTVAKNETAHAKAFFDMMHEKAGKEIANVEFTAGYPYSAGTLEEGLKFSAMSEKDEAETVYPAFRDVAKEEGFDDVAALYDRVIEVERAHHEKFVTLYQAVKDKTLYKKDEKQTWRCSYCGYTAEAKSAWQTCPLCGKKQGYVEIPATEED